MRRLAIAGVAVLSAAQLAGCPYLAAPSTSGVRVRTSLGEFVIELYADSAPVTVQNFLQYVEDDFYDDTVFHRAVVDFVVQGGGYTADLVLKETRAPIASEADNGRSNTRGTVAMARTDDPNSATAQFFVNLEDNTELDETTDRPGYTVFGQVVEGMEVVDLIAAVPTEHHEDLADVPVEPVIIEDVQVVVLSDGLLELTPAGEQYVESIQFNMASLIHDLLAELVGYMLVPP